VQQTYVVLVSGSGTSLASKQTLPQQVVPSSNWTDTFLQVPTKDRGSIPDVGDVAKATLPDPVAGMMYPPIVKVVAGAEALIAKPERSAAHSDVTPALISPKHVACDQDLFETKLSRAKRKRKVKFDLFMRLSFVIKKVFELKKNRL
jgi:hypothetical protein